MTFLYENEAPGLEQAVVVTMATRVLRPLKRVFLRIPPECLTACKILRGVENCHFPRGLLLTDLFLNFNKNLIERIFFLAGKRKLISFQNLCHLIKSLIYK